MLRRQYASSQLSDASLSLSLSLSLSFSLFVLNAMNGFIKLLYPLQRLAALKSAENSQSRRSDRELQ